MTEEQVFFTCFMVFWIVVLAVFEWDEYRMKKYFKPGDKVIFLPTGEKGIVKSVKGRVAHIVYHCDENWRNYNNYTGELTSISSLEKGW